MHIDFQAAVAKIKTRITVDANNCWNWNDQKNKLGYGSITLKKTDTGKWSPHLVHRIMCWFHNGAIPKGKVVMHLCNNSSCCNPDHLQVGTYAENMQMAIADGLWDPRAAGAKGGKYVRTETTKQRNREGRARTEAKKKGTT